VAFIVENFLLIISELYYRGFRKLVYPNEEISMRKKDEFHNIFPTETSGFLGFLADGKKVFRV
jgi:hypothetical protein